MMSKKKKILISMTIALALIFSITYYLADKYIGNNNYSQNQTTQTSKTYNEEKPLNDSVKIYLFAGEKKEKESTIADLKKELNLDENLTEKELDSILKEKGYSIDIASSGQIVFKREPSKSLEGNKYYIGEKDGFLAIYKTDDKGTPMIENNEDVYSEYKTVESLKEGDKSKIRNFEFKFNSKEDAEESLSEFLS